jgi:membrane protein required for colicin V production
MTVFDFGVIGFALLALALGFNAGLLRSLATILGYGIAVLIAAAVTPPLAYFATDHSDPSGGPAVMVLFVVFLGSALVISALLNRAVGDMAGSTGPYDRVAGAALGVVRIVLLAVAVMTIFEHIIPPDREPHWMAQSRLRPLLSAAGRQGLRVLPPDVMGYIDRLKKQRGI